MTRQAAATLLPAFTTDRPATQTPSHHHHKFSTFHTKTFFHHHLSFSWDSWDTVASSATSPTHTEVLCEPRYPKSPSAERHADLQNWATLHHPWLGRQNVLENHAGYAQTSCACRVGRFHSVAAAAAVIPQKLPRSPTRRVVFEVKLYLISNFHDNYLVSGHRSVKIKTSFAIKLHRSPYYFQKLSFSY